jgi:hypothetical protein
MTGASSLFIRRRRMPPSVNIAHRAQLNVVNCARSAGDIANELKKR